MKKKDAAEMVNRCFRHQHPEAYGGEAPPEGEVPPSLRFGIAEHYTGSAQHLHEEAMGNGESLYD